MIPRRKPSTLLIVCLLMAALTITFDRSAGMAATIDAALNVMGYDREVAISINGHPISKITGGQSQSVRLFVADDPRIKTFPPEMQKRMRELFCLQEGENSIEISFKQTGKPAAPSRFTVTLEADGYPVPVLEYAQNPEVKEGHAKGTFAIYSKAPAGFATVVLK
jgi:hypothetical protein